MFKRGSQKTLFLLKFCLSDCTLIFIFRILLGHSIVTANVKPYHFFCWHRRRKTHPAIARKSKNTIKKKLAENKTYKIILYLGSTLSTVHRYTCDGFPVQLFKSNTKQGRTGGS